MHSRSSYNKEGGIRNTGFAFLSYLGSLSFQRLHESNRKNNKGPSGGKNAELGARSQLRGGPVHSLCSSVPIG